MYEDYILNDYIYPKAKITMDCNQTVYNFKDSRISDVNNHVVEIQEKAKVIHVDRHEIVFEIENKYYVYFADMNIFFEDARIYTISELRENKIYKILN